MARRPCPLVAIAWCWQEGPPGIPQPSASQQPMQPYSPPPPARQPVNPPMMAPEPAQMPAPMPEPAPMPQPAPAPAPDAHAGACAYA